MRIGLFFKYDREVVNGSENREIPDLWGRVDRYALTRELKIRVVGLVLKKLLTYFEMLIVPHALQCVDGCFFCILPHLTSCF